MIAYNGDVTAVESMIACNGDVGSVIGMDLAEGSSIPIDAI